MGNIDSLNGGVPVRADEENTGGDFQVMPAGWYPVSIDKAEVRDTKNKKGKYVWLELTVIGDRYAGRKLFPKLNILNENATAQQIGQRDLGFLGQACGLAAVSDTDELLGKQLDVRVKVRKAEGDYPEDNEVTAYDTLGKRSSQAPGEAKPKGSKPASAPRAWDKPPEGNAPAPESAAPAAAPATPPASTTAPAASTTSAPVKGSRPWEKKS